MKVFKTLSLTAVAVTAMAFISAPSASATLNTLLCKVHQEPCPAASLPSSIHLVSGTMVLKTSLVTILCLGSLITGTPLGLGTAPSPQIIHLTQITWTGCGTNVAHNNCTVTTIAPGLLDILRTALNLGTDKFLNMQIQMICGEITSCTYGGAEVAGLIVEGALHTAEAGHGMFTANELSLPVVGGFLCAATNKLTVLYEPLEHLFLVG